MLSAWRASPTRLREDAAAESDLARGGYRDRLLTELAQNAVDAAAAAGVPARMWVRRVGATIRVANVGRPLDRFGVQALGSLRASDKAPNSGHTGRYGVGFTAVRSVADAVEVRSRNGSIRFDAAATAQAIRDRGIDSGVLERHGLVAPVLRLPWWIGEVPPDGWDTEIVLYPDPALDIEKVMAGLVAEAPEVLFELSGLSEMIIDEPSMVLSRTVTQRPDGIGVVTIGTRMSADGDQPTDGPTSGDRQWWMLTSTSAGGAVSGAGVGPAVRWLWPVVDGRPARAEPDVLRAPTRSDEPITVPALVIADLPLQPDRRRLMPSVRPEDLCDGYAEMAARLPVGVRAIAVPAAGLRAGPVDAALRAAIDHELRTQPWVADVEERPIPAREAVILPDADEEAVAVFADLLPGLVHPGMSGHADTAALRTVGARILGVADLVDAVTGITRPPSWWRRAYAVLDSLIVDAVDRENCGSLPVPLLDGRLVTGPRTTVIAEGLDEQPVVDWARVVHPAAVHPLLTALGAQTARAADLLADPALHERIVDIGDLVADRPDDPDMISKAHALAESVLTLAATIDRNGSAAPVSGSAPAGLGELLLEDADGGLSSADELLLPGAPLREIFGDDSPMGVVADRLVDRFGADALRTVGVGWTFTVVLDDAPTGPDHLLDDEETWWDQLTSEPEQLVAVRDLDLIAPERFLRAVELMMGEPQTAAALADRAGYTCWWLRTHARIDGMSPSSFTDHNGAFAGVLDPWPGVRTPAGVIAGDRVEDDEQAAELLRRLAAPERVISGETAARVHRLLADAVADGRVDPADVDPPERVRVASGAAADAGASYVLDRPWLAAVVDPDATVLGSLDTAADLADLLDIECASTVWNGAPVSEGEEVEISDDPRWAVAAVAGGIPTPRGRVIQHPALVVRSTGGQVRVPFWRDGPTVHVDREIGPGAVTIISTLLTGRDSVDP